MQNSMTMKEKKIKTAKRKKKLDLHMKGGWRRHLVQRRLEEDGDGDGDGSDDANHGAGR